MYTYIVNSEMPNHFPVGPVSRVSSLFDHACQGYDDISRCLPWAFPLKGPRGGLHALNMPIGENSLGRARFAIGVAFSVKIWVT